MRCVSTRVLPEPAPATTSSGPSWWVTASALDGVQPARAARRCRRRDRTSRAALSCRGRRHRYGAPTYGSRPTAGGWGDLWQYGRTVAAMTPRNVVVVLLDSLNRHLLGGYGGTEFDTPNLDRLAARGRALHRPRHRLAAVHARPPRPARRRARLPVAAVGLDRGVGGRRSPYQLRAAGVTTMLVSDHPHLFETGGENYHTDFDAWDYVRGHEGDPWRTRPDPSWIGRAGARARPAPWQRRRTTSVAHVVPRRGRLPGPADDGGGRATGSTRATAPYGPTTASSCSSTSSIRTSRSTRPSRGRPATTTVDPWTEPRLIWPPYARDAMSEAGLDRRARRATSAPTTAPSSR